MNWIPRLRYDIVANSILIYFKNYWDWKYVKERYPIEEYQEQMKDAVGCYCMGGEL